MKKLFLFISICAFLFPVSAQVMWQFNKDTVITWQYEWGDEFNGVKLDTVKWTYGGGGRSIYNNKEQQYYTDGKNHVVGNGVLKLVARKENVEARTIDWMEDKDSLMAGGIYYGPNKRKFSYTSGMIQSSRLFTNGFFEIRFKAPKDRGMWPAFWLFGGFPNEEIDIFELKGEKANKTHIDVHCANDCDYFKTWYGKKQKWGGWISLSENITEGYNVMAAEWQDNYIKFYVNGKCIGYVPVNFKVIKRMEANLALSADDGPFHPGPKKSFTLSDDFEIDYIRVWNKPVSVVQKMSIQDPGVRTSFSEVKQGHAQIKKKDKFMYGKKSVHENDGAIFSIFPSSQTSYLFYAAGMEKGAQAEIELKDKNNKTVYSVKASDFQTKLDFSTLEKGDYSLRVFYNSKQTVTKIVL